MDFNITNRLLDFSCALGLSCLYAFLGLVRSD